MSWRHLACVLLPLILWSSGTWAGEPNDAHTIRQVAEVQGGVVVHVGCGDGQLTAALQAGERWLVHGLAQQPQQVAAARTRIQAEGKYGRASVDQYDGRQLPYIDNCVNLIVVDTDRQVPRSELLRVLVPLGVICIQENGRWTKAATKPWPAEIDQWTHYLHDPSNNAVAHDSAIEPPSRYQWLGGPRYSRHHDHMSSVSAVVSAQGRLFYIFDEAPRASILTPPQWKLIARDAFNGTILWKRDIDTWHPHLWRLKSGPQSLARRLVAIGDRVYVTLGITAPLSILDAATGETIQTLTDTATVEEILCLDGELILSTAQPGQPLRSDPTRRYASLAELNDDVTNPLWSVAERTVQVLDAESGEPRWSITTPLANLSLAADEQHVLLHDGQRIRCIERRAGDVVWESEPLPINGKMRSSGGVTLVLYDDVVLYSGQTSTERSAGGNETTMFALAKSNGRLLWQAPHHPCGHMGTPDDILVAGGLVWNGAVAKGNDSGTMTGRDPHTGEVQREFAPDVETHWFHHRCYRAKATDKYLLFSRTGIEFIDPQTQHWTCHHWVRGACHYGILPCNGLIYAPQHPCACYIEAKLYGFTALAPRGDSPPPRRVIPDAERLVQGPAYDPEPAAVAPSSEDWPTFRHDAVRSGASATTVSTDQLGIAWTQALGDTLSTPVVAQGLLLVAASETHAIHALDAHTGQPRWTFTAGGRIDSPPTVWRDRALFGSADGHVYAVRLRDGALIWRFRAAPEDRRMCAYGQVESVWPLHGSVLIQNETLYCVAGRSMFLDGGLRLLRLDPASGRNVSETILDDQDPETQENLQTHIQGLNMPVALPDILSSDGKYIYMRSLPLDLDGQRKYVAYVPVKEQEGDDLHLFCPTGFLDDSLWHRTYWGYGRAWASGAGGYYQAGRVIPAGRPIVFDDQNVYGFGRLWKYFRWTTPMEFHLFAANKQPEIVHADDETKPVKKQGKRVGSRKVSVTRFVPDWSNDVPVQVNSMVLTNHTLFAAGPPDLEDEEQSVRSLADRATQQKLAEQGEAVAGRRGAVLVAFSRRDGSPNSAFRLDCVPRFDGLIAAGGRLYLTTQAGEVLCIEAGQAPR